jgi:Arc/MetJ-type ribon-helix-helix transcriptional regulator
MPPTQRLNVTLPNETVERVKAKVSAGEYATESEVIRDGLRPLAAGDNAVETWLSKQVVPACEALKVDSSSALTVEQVREHLAKKRERTSKGSA